MPGGGGQPILKKMWQDIEAMGGVDRIIERHANGETLGSIAAELGVSRGFMSWKINKVPGVKERLAEARRMRADVLAEEALSLADGVPEDAMAIRKVQTQVDVRKWLAGVNDPERYGTQKAAVQVNIGSLHLDALRRVQTEMKDVTPKGDEIDGSFDDGDA